MCAKANRGQHRELEKYWSFQKKACPQLSRTQANRDDFSATSALVHELYDATQLYPDWVSHQASRMFGFS
jgi:hypothetical protein